MSNITLFKSGNVALPDYLREPDDLTKMLAGGAGGKQISIKGGVWRMIVGGEEVAKNEDRAMNFIVVGVGANTNRTFYKGKYEEGKTVDPTCWSEDGKTPDAEVPAAARQSSLRLAVVLIDGQRFIDWIVSPAGQAAIASYRINGEQLFFPNARQPEPVS
jgi:hypothetical protein